jgi:cystathionine beta-lyase/cystathionine gamma-synthase
MSPAGPAVDLYSDTVTRPTTAMRRFMCDAEVGDEQQLEDPTVNRLQEIVAELLGKEAALFLPSGTMCNQIALRVHCRPGDEMLAHRTAHPIHTEPGQPCESSSGNGRGPRPSSWMKWRSMPPSGTVNWRKPFRIASCLRQSYVSRQYTQRSLT